MASYLSAFTKTLIKLFGCFCFTFYLLPKFCKWNKMRKRHVSNRFDLGPIPKHLIQKCDSVLFPNAVKVGGFIAIPGRKKVLTPDEDFKGQIFRKTPTSLYTFVQNFVSVLGSLALSFYSHQQITMETVDEKVILKHIAYFQRIIY